MQWATDTLHTLWEREFVRYVCIGVVNTAVGQLGYLLLNLFIPYLAAYWLTYVAGIVLSYVLNARCVFRQPLAWRKLLQFPLVYLVQLAISSVAVVFLVEQLRVSESLAPLIVIALTVPLTFILSRSILKPAAEPAVEGIT